MVYMIYVYLRGSNLTPTISKPEVFPKRIGLNGTAVYDCCAVFIDYCSQQALTLAPASPSERLNSFDILFIASANDVPNSLHILIVVSMLPYSLPLCKFNQE